MEKSIVTAIRDDEKGLVLNTSYNEFVLNSDVTLYEKVPHTVDSYTEPFKWECLCFSHHGYDIELWCEDKKVRSICCRQSCLYKGKELIMMRFLDFLSIIQEQPKTEDTLYVSVNNSRGQNHNVYDFELSGLQVWVWRGKIRTIVIYDTYANE